MIVIQAARDLACSSPYAAWDSMNAVADETCMASWQQNFNRTCGGSNVCLAARQYSMHNLCKASQNANSIQHHQLQPFTSFQVFVCPLHLSNLLIWHASLCLAYTERSAIGYATIYLPAGLPMQIQAWHCEVHDDPKHSSGILCSFAWQECTSSQLQMLMKHAMPNGSMQEL